MNNLANMMKQSGMPMNTLPSGRPFGSQNQQPPQPGVFQQTQFGGGQPQFGGGNAFGFGQPSSNPLQFNQRQQPQNHQWQPGARFDAWKQAHPNFGQNMSGWQPPQGRWQPPQFGGNGYFDGDLGQPDQGWKPWGGW